MFFLFFWYFLYLHFKWYPLSWYLPWNPLSHHLSPFFFVNVHPPTNNFLPALAFPYTGTSSLHRNKDLSWSWCQAELSCTTYPAGPMSPSMSIFGWWFSPWELWGFWMVDIVILPMVLQTPSAPSVLNLTPPLGSLNLVQWLAVIIHLCICQALAEPFRKQLYQAPVSKHFLAFAIIFKLAPHFYRPTL